MSKRKTIPVTGTLPAGKYYVGDPCYVIDNAKWDDFLEAWYEPFGGDGNKAAAAVFEFEGHSVFVTDTNTGDGIFEDQHGAVYPVDAGMIAAIPVALVKRKINRDCPGWVADCINARTTFGKRFEVGADKGRWIDNGKRIQIGNIVINT